MISRIRSYLTYANVISTVCLFIVLGGTSYAVATGSIDSREIKNNSVRGADVRNGTLTGRDISRSTLGQLRGAQGPQGFPGARGPQGAQGPQGPPGPVEAELFSGQLRTTGIPFERQFFAAPGVGTVDYHYVGAAFGGCFVSFTNTSGQDVYVAGVRSASSAAPSSVAQVVGNGERITLAGTTFGPVSAFSHLQATRADATKVLELTSSIRWTEGAPHCVGSVQGTLNG